MTLSDETDNPLRWYWAESEDAERWTGCFETREEAIADAAVNGCWNDDPPDPDEPHKHVIHLAHARRMSLFDDIFDADSVLEDWHDHNDEAADDGGDLKMHPSDHQKEELTGLLADVLRKWRARHGLGRAWRLDIQTTSEAPLPVAHG